MVSVLDSFGDSLDIACCPGGCDDVTTDSYDGGSVDDCSIVIVGAWGGADGDTCCVVLVGGCDDEDDGMVTCGSINTATVITPKINIAMKQKT